MDNIIKLADKNQVNRLIFFWNDIKKYHTGSSILKKLDGNKEVKIFDFFSEESFEKQINAEGCFFYIIEENNELIGTILFKKNEKNPGVISILNFQLLPGYQNKNYEEKILIKSINDIKNMPYKRIDLLIKSDNKKIISIFKKLGFFSRNNTPGMMSNYFPLIYKLEEAKGFFRKHDWLDSLKNDFDNKPGPIKKDAVSFFKYNWECSDEKLEAIVNPENDTVIDIGYKKSRNEKFEKIDFEQYSGKNIKVGIIDSGIDSTHPYIKHVNGGINLILNDDNHITMNNEYSDTVGHGTACAGIIRKKAPASELYSIKIFQNESLSCSLDLLVEGIKWAIDNGMNIINLSLGTTGERNISKLYEICEYAKNKGVIIVAADNNENITSYPSVFLNVIGVTGAEIKGKYKFYYNSKNFIPFLARGDRQRLAWKDNQNIFLGGTSFAAPHITGIIALLLERNPGLNFNEVYEYLINNAEKGQVDVYKDISIYNEQFQINDKKSKECNFENVEIIEKEYRWIKSACIYPFNKEMHALVRGVDLLDFKITAIADPIGKGLVGKDSGEALGIDKIGITIEHNVKKALSKSDTLILGHVKELSIASRRNIFRESVEKAIDLNKNIYFIDPYPLWTNEYTDLFKAAKKKGLIIECPKLEEIDDEKAWSRVNLPINKPVVGIFGTGPQQGKFTFQLALRRQLLKEGYNIGQIGTEPHSELFGFDMAYPIGYESLVKWPEHYSIMYLHNKILDLVEKKNPDIIVVGCQSGIIPIDINYFQNLTLPSITFLFGTKPDAYILCVNTIDEDEFINASINALHYLGKGKTILLGLSDHEKVVKTLYGRTFIQKKKLDKKTLNNKIKQLEDKFGLPVTEVVSDEGQKKLLDSVVKFFAKK